MLYTYMYITRLLMYTVVMGNCSGIYVFFFNETATTEIDTYCHTLSLHDALPICERGQEQHAPEDRRHASCRGSRRCRQCPRRDRDPWRTRHREQKSYRRRRRRLARAAGRRTL